jgi:hypothetical protein
MTLSVDIPRDPMAPAAARRAIEELAVARDRPATDVGGWGLHLVQTLSERWGVHEGSTHVWFEIEC